MKKKKKKKKKKKNPEKRRRRLTLNPTILISFWKKGKRSNIPKEGEEREEFLLFFFLEKRRESGEREITRLSKILSRALLFARALFFVPRVFHRFRSSRRANTVLPPPVSTPEERRGKGEGEKRDATQQRTKTWEEKRKGGKEI